MTLISNGVDWIEVSRNPSFQAASLYTTRDMSIASSPQVFSKFRFKPSAVWFNCSQTGSPAGFTSFGFNANGAPGTGMNIYDWHQRTNHDWTHSASSLANLVGAGTVNYSANICKISGRS